MADVSTEQILRLVCDHTGQRVSLDLVQLDQYIAFARGAIAVASRPAEVDDEWLPPLPKPACLVPGVYAFTWRQYRQGQRDSVAASQVLLHECKRFLEDMHSMPIEWTIKESQVLHEKLSAPSHTTNKEK